MRALCPSIWVFIVSTSVCRRFSRSSLSSSALFLAKFPMRSVLTSSFPLDRLTKTSLDWVSWARRPWLSCWEAIAEINSDEGKWPVKGVPVMQWHVWYACNVFKDLTGWTRKLLELETGNLIEGTSCCRESFFKGQGSPYPVGHSPWQPWLEENKSPLPPARHLVHHDLHHKPLGSLKWVRMYAMVWCYGMHGVM